MNLSSRAIRSRRRNKSQHQNKKENEKSLSQRLEDLPVQINNVSIEDEVSESNSTLVDDNRRSSLLGASPRTQSTNSLTNVLRNFSTSDMIYTLCGSPPPGNNLDEDKLPLETQMRRSNSSPATFRQSSSGSAFGRVRSASSITRKKASVSDPGVPATLHFSAFDPVLAKTSDMSTKQDYSRSGKALDKGGSENNSLSTDAFLQKSIKAKRRERRQRNGKENSSKDYGSPPLNNDESKMEGKIGISEGNLSSGLMSSSENASGNMNLEGSIRELSPEKHPLVLEDVREKDLKMEEARTEKLSAVNKQKIIEVDEVIEIENCKSFHNGDEELDEIDDNVSILPFGSQQDGNDHHISTDNAKSSDFQDREDDNNILLDNDQGSTVEAESPTPIPSPCYQKFIDEELTPTQNISNTRKYHSQYLKTPPAPKSSIGRDKSHKRLLLPHKVSPHGNMSPSSYDSCSHSRATIRSSQSNNTSRSVSTSISESFSCNQTVTSSVVEADREVMETNRRERRRLENINVDPDGNISVHSFDTASTNTNAYLALASSPAPAREGANMPVDRFLSSGRINVTIMNPIMNGRPPMNARSPATVSSNSQAYTQSSSSTGEEPPLFVSCPTSDVARKLPSKTVPITKSYPPRSDNKKSDDIAYSKLGSEDKHTSHYSSSSKSSSSKSSSSKSSKRKDKTRKYQKMDHISASTPSPSHSVPASPCGSLCNDSPRSPPSKFMDSHEAHAHVRNHMSKTKVILFPPDESPYESIETTHIVSPQARDAESFALRGSISNERSRLSSKLDSSQEFGNSAPQSWNKGLLSQHLERRIVSPERD